MNKQQKLAMLLQPALIRLIDQLRQQLKSADWDWSYDTQEAWPEEASESERSQYTEMMQALETASDEDAERIQDILQTLPQPIPIYQLSVTYNDVEHLISMWELCYQICFERYIPRLSNMSVQPPEIDQYEMDATLFDADEAIDWAALNQKAKVVVSMLVQHLESENRQ